MGIFDFLKDVGANLFGAGKNEAEEIEKLLVISNRSWRSYYQPKSRI